MKLIVAWVDPSGRPRTRALRGEIFVGRDPGSGIVLDAASVANLHATLDGTRLPPVVAAVSPDAAVFVNGALVKSAPLSDGDTVRFGNVDARILLAARWPELAAPPPASAPAVRPAAGRTFPAALPPVESAKFPFLRVGLVAAAAFALAGSFWVLRNVKWRDRLDASYVTSEKGLRERLEKEIADREKAEGAAQASSEQARRAADEAKRAAERATKSFADAETLQGRVRSGAAGGVAAAPAGPAPGTSPLDRALDSVVAITGETQSEGSLGSGFFVTEQGHVVTNAHVVELRAEYRLHLRDGRVVPVEIQDRDRVRDLAVLRPKSPGAGHMPVLVFGRARDLHIGDPVFAAGSPLAESLGFTVTRGIVSADIRAFGSVRLLQHDCAINPGNSGGPLLDGQGRVVGINTLKIRDAAGLGFAIPIEVAEELLKVWKVRG